eukprot:gnl/Trimastix_PCT/3498.p1 GENE.gnl/Trimastix_PCT/3498~~gnl/Trimastix_PCT/3498.p1  ORF type:complete len:430 (+),score=59.21 gnl/Trimastix_PCT/3498:33-1322(+)
MAGSAKTAEIKVLYEGVIDDVLNRVRGIFQDEGIEEHVLQQLSTRWRLSLGRTGVISLYDEAPIMNAELNIDPALMMGNFLQMAQDPMGRPQDFMGQGPGGVEIPPSGYPQYIPPQVPPLMVSPFGDQMPGMPPQVDGRPLDGVALPPPFPEGSLPPGASPSESSGGPPMDSAPQLPADPAALAALFGPQFFPGLFQPEISNLNLPPGMPPPDTPPGVPTGPPLNLTAPPPSAPNAGPAPIQRKRGAHEISTMGPNAPTLSTQSQAQTSAGPQGQGQGPSQGPAPLAQYDGPRDQFDQFLLAQQQRTQRARMRQQQLLLQQRRQQQIMRQRAAQAPTPEPTPTPTPPPAASPFDTPAEPAEEEEEHLSDVDSQLSDEDQCQETENLILAQYEKVTRIKTKWKCTLKNGIMHINNRDYAFHKAIGEFDWA